MTRWFERECLDETIELKGESRIIVGNLTAHRCAVRVSRRVEAIFVHSTFVDCNVTCESKRLGMAQHQVTFERCTFHGTFEWKFGGREKGPRDSVIDCDFTDARLHDCCFYDCDVRCSRFAGWPTIVFVEPTQRASEIRRAPWPTTPKAAIWVHVLLDHPTAAVVVDAIKVAEYMETTPERLRTIVGGLGAAVLSGFH